ncbi:MAG: hypothetical protein NT169_05355 [Chloroflexi bacterium]|nr:hypothetical protein [Chloroflexota bacterium]
MVSTRSPLTASSSFYAAADDSQRDAVLEAYIAYLERRNGRLDPKTGTLPLREASLDKMNASPIRFAGKLSQADFDQLYANFAPKAPALTPELLLLLTFCKMNAGEAYGVRIVKAVHGRRDKDRTDLASRVILVAQEEEEYHTRILVGAAHYFGIRADGVYHPKPALKVLIHSIAYAPRLLFHPILFASEAVGVYLFNWTLNRVSAFYKGQPELQDALAQRLTEILIDEIGHVAFNRTVMGPRGRRLGRSLALQTVRGMTLMTPELAALGFDRAVERDFAAFDFRDLPQEVRSRGFFA